MSELKNINEQIIELTNAFKNVCEGINQATSQSTFNKGEIQKDVQTVSGNLLKLINIKCSLLIPVILSIEPLAENPI